MRIPKTIVEKGAGKPMFRVRLAEELGLGPEGDKFGSLITASKGYGLTKGSRTAERIELEARGQEIVEGNPDAVLDALLSLEPLAGFYNEYRDRTVPTPGVLKDFLRNTLKVPERQIEHVRGRMLRDAGDWGIIQDRAGGQRVVPLEMARDKAAAQLGMAAAPLSEQTEPAGAQEAPEGRRVRTRVETEPSLQLSIAIHISPDTPEETIETIFRNMNRYLLRDE
jgi:hypothetical protein